MSSAPKENDISNKSKKLVMEQKMTYLTISLTFFTVHRAQRDRPPLSDMDFNYSTEPVKQVLGQIFKYSKLIN